MFVAAGHHGFPRTQYCERENKALDRASRKGCFSTDAAPKIRTFPVRKPNAAEQEVSEVPEAGAIHTPKPLPLSKDTDAYRSPLLIFTCHRQQYLAQTLDDILENIGDHCAFGCPVIVSEDGKHTFISQLFPTCTYYIADAVTSQGHTNQSEPSLKTTLRGFRLSSSL